ncbi:hypothetical protein [Sphingobacterium sp.]|uniref:hypothetical protein n=1 Tax=Sphingobacterium sp. TaxID=341027 RepID=UPI002FDD5A63
MDSNATGIVQMLTRNYLVNICTISVRYLCNICWRSKQVRIWSEAKANPDTHSPNGGPPTFHAEAVVSRR